MQEITDTVLLSQNKYDRRTVLMKKIKQLFHP